MVVEDAHELVAEKISSRKSLFSLSPKRQLLCRHQAARPYPVMVRWVWGRVGQTRMIPWRTRSWRKVQKAASIEYVWNDSVLLFNRVFVVQSASGKWIIQDGVSGVRQ